MKAGVGVRRPERKRDAYEQRMPAQLHTRTDMYFKYLKNFSFVIFTFHMDGCIEVK